MIADQQWITVQEEDKETLDKVEAYAVAGLEPPSPSQRKECHDRV